MALISRVCERCGRQFKSATSRARFCTGACRSAAAKARSSTGKVVALPGAGSAGVIESRVWEELGAQRDTAVGQQALLMARRLDAGVSDSALRSVSQRLEELLTEASRRSAVVSAAEDVVDNPIAFLIRRAEERHGGSVGAGSAGVAG